MVTVTLKRPTDCGGCSYPTGGTPIRGTQATLTLDRRTRQIRSSRSDGPSSLLATIDPVSEPTQQPLEHQLEEIGTQLTWVRDYL